MPQRSLKSARVVHKSTGGTLPAIPQPVDPVGNPPPLISNTVAHPHEIVASLCVSGVIDKGMAHCLEQRIAAWTDSQKAEGRRDGITEALRRAQATVARIRSAAQRLAAEKPLRANEKFLPQGAGCSQRSLCARLYRRCRR